MISLQMEYHLYLEEEVQGRAGRKQERMLKMKSFIRGMLVGVGVGLLVAPMRGQDMRNLLRERFEDLRGYLPENDQLNQYVQQVSDSVTQTSSNLKSYAQQAAARMKDTGSGLGELAQKATNDVKQTSQDVAQTTKQAAQSAKQSAQSGSGTRSTGTTAPAPTAYPEYVNPEKKNS
jgi:gas vesicle protein